MSDDDAFRDALRDLIPDYTGPDDPLPRVIATVRRRRVRHRTLLAVGGTGLAVVLALAAPALFLPGHGAGGGGNQAAAPYDPSAPKVPRPPVHPVAAGVVGGAHWAIGSTTLAAGARRCLVSDDDVSNVQVNCFDGWKPGAPVTWAADPLSNKGFHVTQITGVAPAGTVSVRVRLASGAPLTLEVRRTPTDPAARFFGDVLPGTVVVRDVTAFDSAGTALGPAVPDPGYVCTSTRYRACAPPK